MLLLSQSPKTMPRKTKKTSHFHITKHYSSKNVPGGLKSTLFYWKISKHDDTGFMSMKKVFKGVMKCFIDDPGYLKKTFPRVPNFIGNFSLYTMIPFYVLVFSCIIINF